MLILDSGIGGLSILQYIKKILPSKNYIYILDNEAFPYGNKTEFFIIQRSIKIIKTIKKKYPINIVVVACNTASTVGLSILRKKFNFPIIGVLPDIHFAKTITKNKIIGLIATKATINSFYTKKIIDKNNSDKIIKIIATNKLASIAEKKIRGVTTSKIEFKNIFKTWINLTVQPDTVILGCTHFIFLKKEIKEILHESIYFVDSKEKVVYAIKKYFHQCNMHKKITENVFLYSKSNKKLKILLFFLKKYNFKTISYINLN